jgi:uncharacterized protein YcfL
MNCINILILIALLLMTGCTTSLSARAVKVQDADMTIMERCKFVADVQGSSGWVNLAASAGMQNAKNEAREQAAEMGATHIIWTGVAGGYSPYATGKAYICK